MKHDAIKERFESYLKQRSLKLTTQRLRIFERAFSTHDHFSAETLYDWMRSEEGRPVSRATVYRTLELLEEGGFIGSFDVGRTEKVYEHVLGHDHHDHMVCTVCGTIVEWHDERIEDLQRQAAGERGFLITSHHHRLMGVCSSCQRKPDAPLD